MGNDQLLVNTAFRQGIESSHIKPVRAAFNTAIVYMILISIYIWISGKIAANISTSVENLQMIELYKGLLYVLITGIGLFVALMIIFKRIQKRDNLIIAQNKNIIASEGLITAGLFSSSVSHDMNNIMFIIIGNAELLAQSNKIDPEDRHAVNEIITASKNFTSLSKQLMEAGKEYIPGEKEPADLSMVIRDTVKFAKVHKKIRFCRLRDDLPESTTAFINVPLFSRALMNLILNAAESSHEPVDILIRMVKTGQSIVIEVHDSGKGVPDEIRDKIFQPFFTSKPRGNGLGLLSPKIFAEQHHGTIQVTQSDLGGACFVLTLPAGVAEEVAPPRRRRSRHSTC